MAALDQTVLPDDRMTYGEARYQVYGTIAGRFSRGGVYATR